jgi:hypothetical protein
MATGRIGVTPVLRTRWSDQPTAGTTSLSGLDDNSVSLVYDVGYEAVYRNGVLLSRGNDYTATDGTTVTLTDATLAGDIIEIFANELVPLTDAISKGQYNAKGALLSATAASTPGVLAVGANDTVLTADSSEATGLKWATPAVTFKPVQIANVTGGYLNGVAANTATTINITQSEVRYIPIYLPGYSFDRIGFRSASAWSGTANVRLGIYNADSTTGLPSTVYLDAGTVSAAFSGSTFEITISNTPPAGFYYLAIVVQSAIANNSVEGVSTNSPPFFLSTSQSGGNIEGAGVVQSFKQSSVTGAFATAVPVVNSGSYPTVGLRIS